MWSAYVAGAVNRQDFLATALAWVSHGNTEDYMRTHRFSSDISELVNYFNSVIDWVRTVFPFVESEMRGLPWGELYEKYHATPYNPAHMKERVMELYADTYVQDRKGVYEFLLGGETDTKLLHIRMTMQLRKLSIPVKQARLRSKGFPTVLTAL